MNSISGECSEKIKPNVCGVFKKLLCLDAEENRQSGEVRKKDGVTHFWFWFFLLIIPAFSF